MSAFQPTSFQIFNNEVILYYYGFLLTDLESYQNYSVFTAPYAVGSKARPDTPITESALFRDVALLANYRPEATRNANFEERYLTENHSGPLNMLLRLVKV